MNKCIAGGLLGLTLAAQAGAGQVAYKVTTNGQSTTTVVDITQAGQTVVVALGTVEAAVDVHFYDIVTDDGVDDVGAIEITGSNTQGFPIRVAVADAGWASVEGAFLDPAESIDPGLRNLGGIQFSNAQLRDSARLNVCVRNRRRSVSPGLGNSQRECDDKLCRLPSLHPRVPDPLAEVAVALQQGHDVRTPVLAVVPPLFERRVGCRGPGSVGVLVTHDHGVNVTRTHPSGKSRAATASPVTLFSPSSSRAGV